MGIDIKTLALAKKYTKDSLDGVGAIAGKNCTIDSITDIPGGHRVVFKWIPDSGTPQTTSMDVMDGEDGEDGTSAYIVIEEITGGHRLTVTSAGGEESFDVMDGEKGDQGEPGEGVPTGGTAGQVLAKKTDDDYDTEWVDQSGGGGGTSNYNALSNKPKIGGVELSGNKSASDLGLVTASMLPVVPTDISAFNNDVGYITASALPIVPTKTSDLTNDSGFITASALPIVPTDVSAFNNDAGYITNSDITGKQNAVLASALPIGGVNRTIVEEALSALNEVKAEKAASAVSGNLAGLDANGNPTDSGIPGEAVPSTASAANKLVTESETIILPAGAGGRNMIFRGAYLGSQITAEQLAAIAAGTFEGLMLGDYWTIDGVNYRIAGFDYWLHCGNTECTDHHIVVVPDTNLYTAKMNDSDITTGGYAGSKMFTTNLTDAKAAINSAFGSSHILSHKELFTKAVTDGKASSWDWYDSTVDLMNECMVYGHNVWGSHPGYETGIDKAQLPLFTARPDLITNRANWWLRDVVSGTTFADVYNGGGALNNSASYALGVRPAFAIF